jgi:hypothetical protein
MDRPRPRRPLEHYKQALQELTGGQTGKSKHGRASSMGLRAFETVSFIVLGNSALPLRHEGRNAKQTKPEKPQNFQHLILVTGRLQALAHTTKH